MSPVLTPTIDHRLARVTNACALIVLGTAVAVLVGWILGVETLKRILPQYASMSFNTALALVAAAGSLWLREHRVARIGLAALAALVGAATFAQYLTGQDFGIDQLFIRDAMHAGDADSAPGRMAPITAACLLLGGMSLVALQARDTLRRAIGESLGLCVAAIGFITLLGYSIGAAELYTIPGFASIALHTGAALFLLGGGLVCAFPDGIVARVRQASPTGRILWLGFGILTSLLLTLGAVAAGRLRLIATELRLLADVARERVTEAQELEINILEYGVGIRMHLSGDPAALRRVVTDADEVARHLAHYERLAETPQQREVVAQFASRWVALRAFGDSLLSRGTASDADLRHLASLRLALDALLDEQIQPDAVTDFEKQKAIAVADLRNTEGVLIILLIGGVVVALATSSTVARSVLSGEAALRESEQRLRLALEAAHLISFEWDIRYNAVRQLLPPGLRPAGGSRDHALTFEGLRDSVHPDDRALYQENIEAALQHPQGEYESEFRILRPNGDVIWLHERGRVERDAQGEPSRLLGVSQNVTVRRRAEEALREADRRKDEFLATLAHELRNPLAPIRNAVQILQVRGPKEPLLQSARDMIDRQVQHMVRLVDDLLDVSRITRGKLELRCERVPLAVIVEHAVEATRPYIARGQHQLHVSLPPTPVILDADPVRLAQVFGNLLHNAAKYTSSGGQIWLTAEQAGAEIVVTVRDTGIGIDEHDLPHVFDMFSQVGPSSTRGDGGLGIGLSLTKGLVEMHHGRIEAYSAGPGKGSRFVVRLPTIESVPARGTESSERDVGPIPPRRILVVDDNRDNAESLASLLRLGGHSVAIAFDGKAALEKAARFAPEIVLLDLGLPELDGYEVCRRLRDTPLGKTTVIIAQTGWGAEEDRQRTGAAGFDAHLVKPVDYYALVRLIHELEAVTPSR